MDTAIFNRRVNGRTTPCSRTTENTFQVGSSSLQTSCSTLEQALNVAAMVLCGCAILLVFALVGAFLGGVIGAMVSNLSSVTVGIPARNGWELLHRDAMPGILRGGIAGLVVGFFVAIGFANNPGDPTAHQQAQ